MTILINENARFLIQGITGKQGQLICAEMLTSGSNIVAGVTPGKGKEVIGEIPIFDSVAQALAHTAIDASVIVVPPQAAKAAALEAIENNISLINIITENIPMHDVAYILAAARDKNIRIIGPSSVGIYSVGRAKSGAIAGGKSERAFHPGSIGIISKSGGMCAESSLVIKQAGLGQSTVIGIGGDVLIGESFRELVPLFEQDPQTQGIVLFGEIGGTAEEDLAEYLMERKKEHHPFTKPIVAFISGECAAQFQNISLGHAGAIIEGKKGTHENKTNALQAAGVIIARVHHEIGPLMAQAVSSPSERTGLNLVTRISKIHQQDVLLRGDTLSQLVARSTFSESIFLLLSGRKPNPAENTLFEKILISIIDHGMGTTSSMAARFIASGGNSLQVGVGGGILSLGDHHGGAIENAMHQMYQWHSQGKDQAKKTIAALLMQRKTIFGFGHRHYKTTDPRVDLILQEIEKIGYSSTHLYLHNIVDDVFKECKGKTIPLNIDGLIAILLCDFGFDPLLGKGIFIIGRTPGLVAQAYEELKYERPVRRIPEEEITYLQEPEQNSKTNKQ